jgi:argininosuccinate lyase
MVYTSAACTAHYTGSPSYRPYGCFGQDVERLKSAYSRVNSALWERAAFASQASTSTGNAPVNCWVLAALWRIPWMLSAAGFSNRKYRCAHKSHINLSKMAEELVIWSTSEFAFIELDDRYASTSSIMPQKKIPTLQNCLRGKSGVVVGSLMALVTTCKALPLSYNRDLQEATHNMWKALETTRARYV